MYYLEQLEKLLLDPKPEVAHALQQLRKDLERQEADRLKDSEQEYWDTVAAIAEGCVDEGLDVDEQVDGNYWVIYIHAAHKVLQYSSNEDAVFEDSGVEGCDSMAEVLTRMAFCAMQADVEACMARLQEERDEQEDEDDEDADGDDD